MMMLKCKGIDFNGRRFCGSFIRFADEYTAVVYCGGYESIFVPRENLEFLQ